MIGAKMPTQNVEQSLFSEKKNKEDRYKQPQNYTKLIVQEINKKI